MAELSVTLTANIDKLAKGLNQAKTALQSFEDKVSRAQKQLSTLTVRSVKTEQAQEALNKAFNEGKISLERYQISTLSFSKAQERIANQISDTRKGISSYNASIRDLGGGKGIGGLGKSTANVVPTMLEFNRIVQDAPFGIQGVANNLTQLVQNFGQLRQTVGGTIPALRAMLGAMAGPAGLLFAVSTITSLLVVFGDKLFKSSDGAKKLADELERVNKTFDAELNLNKQLKENLEIQGLSTDNINDARKEILQRQLASVGAVLAENTALLQQLKIQNEIVSDWELITQLAARAAALVAVNVVGAYDATKKVLDAIRKPLESLLGIEIDRSKFSAASAKDKQKEAELNAENLRIQTQIQAIIGEILKLNQSNNKELDKTARLYNGFIPQGLDQIFKVTQGIGPALVKPITLASREVKPKLALVEEALREFNANASDIIQGSIGNTFSNLGEAIGAGLASGENIFNSLGKGLLSSMGQFLSSMGDLLIKYGTLAVAKGKIDAAIAAGGPIAIGAGLAAIAVGVALKAAGGAIARSATKGFGVGFDAVGTGRVGGQGSFSSSGGSYSVSGSSGLQNVVFEIRGTSLIGVLKNTSERNLRLGGNQLAF